jgi:RNA polymerase sigma-70 factor (ECF subfamily)
MFDDKEILEIYQQGGREEYAFNLLVRKYQERLYWHIRQLVMDHEQTNDLLQNTLVKAWRYLPDFRGDSKLFTWLYKIATNETLTYLKKERLKNVFSLSDTSNMLEQKLLADEYFSGDELQLALYKEINKLPPKQRTVFTMRYFDEVKYEDMVEILGGSVGSLKASYHHAYNKIKKNLMEEF